MITSSDDFLSTIPVLSKKLYCHDDDEVQRLLKEKPWTNDPQYFKKVQISVLALMKIVTHAHSGGNIEIMGLMTGKVIGDTFWIMDAFSLPVEGTETRVNAGDQANEFMVSYISASEGLGRQDSVVAWYHSHPGYGCWLSGIDVDTTQLYQTHQDPICAIVIDPHRTLQNGKIEVGAFRTFPKGQLRNAESSNPHSNIPDDKINDFGNHWRSYYSLEVELFRSEADELLLKQLYSDSWTSALAENSLLSKVNHFAADAKLLAKECRCRPKHVSSTVMDNAASLTGELLARKEIDQFRKELFAPILIERPL
eukprot:GDKJ01002021.1.p1 GENE.GDKJ01002021.1~~GDKJ01002021.1.p1  ORF type:complete len:310 (+),score=40.12 GDKJ01002021.1:14-943(+)